MARYRRQSATGDYTFGQSAANFLVNSAEMVAQSIKTRLLLWQGEFFLDVTEGTPWSQDILGVRTNPTYDLVIQNRILETPGVSGILEYESFLDGRARHLSVRALVNTIYSTQPIRVTI
jgi:hypothetical protein